MREVGEIACCVIRLSGSAAVTYRQDMLNRLRDEGLTA